MSSRALAFPSGSLRKFGIQPIPVSPFALTLVALGAIFLLTTILLLHATRLIFDFHFLQPLFRLGLAFVGLSFAIQMGNEARREHWRKIQRGCFYILLTIGFASILEIPTYSAARFAAPYQDALMMDCDRWLHVSVLDAVGWCAKHPIGHLVFDLIYNSLPVLLIAGTLLPAICGKFHSIRRLLFSSIIADVLALVILACLPVLGPWHVYHFTPTEAQASYVKTVTALRGTGPFVIDPHYSSGLITFPSFHVVLAVLSVIALWPFRWLRLPAMALALAISISTVMLGWHYATDVVGGLLIVFVATYGAERILRALQSDALPLRFEVK
jgi:membrane-associated phospholipid phosphatase